jgi:DNA-binding response OmpR family regulator
MTVPLILLVEDDPDVRMVLEFFFEQRGYRLSTANDYKVGAEILRDTHPDLLVSDVMLRGGTGKALACLARTMNIPVLLISGSPDAEKLLQGDPSPFLPKPFRLVDLEREIDRLLRPR